MSELEVALTQARDCARCGGINGAPEVHVTPSEQHDPSADCWCGPELHYRDPETGVAVYQHREIC